MDDEEAGGAPPFDEVVLTPLRPDLAKLGTHNVAEVTRRVVVAAIVGRRVVSVNGRHLERPEVGELLDYVCFG